LRIRAQDGIENVRRVRHVGAPGIDEERQLVERRLVEEVADRMQDHGAAGRRAQLVLKIGRHPADGGISREVEVDLPGKGRRIERRPGRSRVVAGQRPVEMAGDAWRQDIVGGRGKHRAEEGKVGET
jgi:hypothetical protein